MGCSTTNTTQSTTTLLSNGTIIISIKNFIIQNTDSMRSHYKPICKIAFGDFAKVFTVFHLNTSTKRIMKIININLIKTSILCNPDKDPTNYEVSILAGIDHPNIQKVYEYFTDGNFYYIILEYVEGKSIVEFIMHSWNNITEVTIAKLFKQIISCLVYLHKYNYVYGNINENNIIVMNNKDNTIKLTGFSLIKQLASPKAFISIIPTSSETQPFLSPEAQTRKQYTTSSDIWACGILLYKLITGAYPSIGNDSSSYVHSHIFKSLNPHLQDILMKMLTIDEEKRISATCLFEHPWLNVTCSDEYGECKMASQVNMICHLSQEKLKMATEAYIVHQMANSKLIDKLRRQFMQYDQSCDGLISRNELKQMLTSFDKNHYTEIEIDEVMNKIDQDKSGEISFEEFTRVMINYESLLTKQHLQHAFDFFDKDKTGTLSMQELKDVFSSSSHMNDTVDSYIRELLEKYDIDKDGQLSFDEFVNLMTYKIVKQVTYAPIVHTKKAEVFPSPLTLHSCYGEEDIARSLNDCECENEDDVKSMRMNMKKVFDMMRRDINKRVCKEAESALSSREVYVKIFGNQYEKSTSNRCSLWKDVIRRSIYLNSNKSSNRSTCCNCEHNGNCLSILNILECYVNEYITSITNIPSTPHYKEISHIQL